ncbi:MAG: hypothetical protein HC846_03940 [Blastocatellia bacterium]|nr:hypothetical protein [Blastocatellia bacterium]
MVCTLSGISPRVGFERNHDPMFGDKYSKLLHLAMFSKALATPQPDWAKSTVQTGFCFYDGNQDMGKMSEDLQKFLDTGEPPIVFTLGSAAVMDARDFYEQSIAAAKMLNRRAVMLYGIFNEPPKGLDNDRVGFDYAPYGQLFPRAAGVVHQGGVGTTSQVLRAGVPMLRNALFARSARQCFALPKIRRGGNYQPGRLSSRKCGAEIGKIIVEFKL